VSVETAVSVDEEFEEDELQATKNIVADKIEIIFFM
jgi:hypothetical protein